MKPRLSSKRNAGMTLLEVGLVFVIIGALVVILLPMLGKAKARAQKISCTGYLMQLASASKVWEGDHHDYFPMGVAVTNGGSMEAVQAGDVVQTFMLMSNELSTPYILCCPADAKRSPTTNFVGLTSSNISYFVGTDLTNDMNPQALIFGDCNFQINGQPVESGLNAFCTNDLVAWQATRHINIGNIGLGDGSVQSATSAGLQLYLQNTGFATNRFAIP
jgi:competence protein ComGC